MTLHPIHRSLTACFSFARLVQKLERMFNGILVHIFPVLRPILVSADVDIVTKGDRISSM